MESFPPHTCYVEPFCGGASVIFQKTPARFEVMNDLNRDVINFFDLLRNQPEALIRAILLTPYSRAELERARDKTPGLEPLERARRFYIRCWQSYGSGVGQTSTGWRFQIGTGDTSRASAIGSFNDVDHLWAVAERLKQVQIECGPAGEVIERFDSSETLFYLDPPYVHSTRYHNSVSKGYAFEMKDEDHRQLSHLVHKLAGMVIISGYPSGLYDELFAGWQCITRESNDVNAKPQIECLWLSPRTTEALAESVNHTPLFRNATA